MIASLPAAIIFDMDGLLLDTERISRETMIAAMATYGFVMTKADFGPLIGTPEDTDRIRLAEMFGPGFDYDAMRVVQARLKAELYGDERPLMRGARSIVELVAAIGIPRGVATSSRRVAAEGRLGHMGLRPYMDVVVTRDDVANGKPAPDLYLAAAAALGQAPAACLALEDSYNGVRAAHAAGIPVIMVPDLLPPTDEMRALVLAIAPDLDVVREWLLTSVALSSPKPT